MISFIFGLALFAAPFLAIGLFSDKKKGFVFVLFYVILFNTILAILTQFFGIFYYNVIIGAIFAADAVLIFFLFKKKNLLQIAGYKLLIAKIDWVLILVIIAGFLTLYQVHYNYTGKINLATDKTVSYHEVKNMKYVYPYFSDEWYAVALVGTTIGSHSLPTISPFGNGFFPNLELFFHSFIAEIILILSIDPLTQYTLLSVFFNILIIVLVYLFLRQNNLSKLISAISALSLLYITCGANMPGLWHLVPFNIGIILCLIMYCFIVLGDFGMVLASFILATLFYPPLFIFYFLALASAAVIKYKDQRKILLKIAGYLLAALFIFIPTASLILMISPWYNFTNYIFSRIFFVSFFAPYIPQYIIYNIILWPIILLATVGMHFISKNKKWLFLQFLLGIFLWSVYSLTTHRFMVEYERVVILTSIILTIIAGFGLDLLIKQIEKYLILKKIKTAYLKYLEVYFLLLFIIFIPFYTQRESWQKLYLIEPETGAMGYPKAPANNYLTDDDLKIFENIKSKRFLSIPWKGTVVATASKNYPVVTKEGTISIGKESLVNDFLMADCLGKNEIAKNLRIDYIYIYEFDCPGFKKIAKTQEGFILYETLP